MSAVDPTPSPARFKIPPDPLDYQNDPSMGATVGTGTVAFCRFPNTAVGDVWGPLFAAAPDHALLLAAVCAGKATVQPLGINWRVWVGASLFTVDLDPFGCPVLHDRLRAALREAIGGGA